MPVGTFYKSHLKNRELAKLVDANDVR